MESPLILLVISLILFIVGIIIYLIVRPTGLKPGKACMSTSECATGLQCAGICVVPKYGSCSYSEDNCISGTSCNNGRCVVIIDKNIVGPPDSGVFDGITTTNIPPSPVPSHISSDLNDTMAIQDPNGNISAPLHTLFYTCNINDTNPLNVGTGNIIAATYHCNKIYYITTTPNVIYVYNIGNKNLENPITHTLGVLEDLESTIYGEFYTRVNTSVYVADIENILDWSRLQKNNVNIYAEAITSDPSRENIYFLNGSEIHKIYTDDPYITLILTPTQVYLYNQDILIETLDRPNGNFPLYINNELIWTVNAHRYFTESCHNNILKYKFIYIQ